MDGGNATEAVSECDVLVVGGGVTGLWCALKAKERVERVLIVDKGPRDWGGQAAMSGGAIVGVIPPEDSLEKSLEDLVYYYEGLCDQELLQTILKGSSEIIHKLQGLGYRFMTDAEGRLKSIPQRALSHVRCYIGEPFGMGGRNMVSCLVRECERIGVRRVGRIMITDVLHDGERATGALGFQTTTGRIETFRAKAVVLALGHSGFKTSYHHNTCAGGGIGIGLKAGLEVSNMEFNRVWIMPRHFQWEGQTHLLPLGAKLVNAKGEVFMDKYSPVFGTNTDPSFVSRGMALETLAGNGPFFLDCSGMPPAAVEMVKPKGDGWMGINYRRLKDELGMDFFEDKLEWIAQQRWSVGGVEADTQGRTAVPGLFASGRTRTTDPTVYAGGLSLALCQVLGSITGECAGTYASGVEPGGTSAAQRGEAKNTLIAGRADRGPTASEALDEIRRAIFGQDVALLKHSASLTRALSRIEELRAEVLPRVEAKDPHGLMRKIEVQEIGLVAELFLRASLMRAESRAGHFRLDHPDRDDANWMCWILAGLDGDGIKLRTKPVPLDRYPVRPTRYYSDNFTFQEALKRIEGSRPSNP
ncbi:MAG: FAD-binding protein [Deltaproteobacteria bacterium]|nr:FAD-binding protein [Deltaproteobacteria bacterium]